MQNKRERAELVRRAARMIRRRTKNTRKLREELGSFEALCPWTDGRIRHPTNEHCVARYCDDAAETFYDEERIYFDEK